MKIEDSNRHSTNQLATFTPDVGEIHMDTTKNTLVVGDGSTKGGKPMMEDDLSNATSMTSPTAFRTATSLYRRYYHMNVDAVNPGASGATFTAPDANTVGGFQLDAATEVLYFEADVHADWDGETDMTVEVKFAVNVDNSGGGAEDTVDLKLVCYYNGLTETATKTQTVEVATTVGQSAQYKVFQADFTIDYDKASNVIEVGDTIAFILNLETDTSEVDNIIILSGGMSFSYPTTHSGQESGDV